MERQEPDEFDLGITPLNRRREMSQEKFSDNLMRMIAAELHFLNTMTAAREMYGRGYFTLGVEERAAIDQTVRGTLAASYQALTPEFLASQVTIGPRSSR
jgi:hypothetical protein